MAVTSVLKSEILLENGKKLTITLRDPKPATTYDDVAGADGFATYLVNENMINYGGLQAVAVGDVYFYNTEKTPIL